MEPDSLSDSLAPDKTPSNENLHEAIRRRAEEVYIRNGRIPGRDLENWTQAELEIRSDARKSTRRTAIIVKVDGVQYVGEYRAETAGDYAPGEFTPGCSVVVHLDGKTMLVKRPNGKVLRTEVVQRIS